MAKKQRKSAAQNVSQISVQVSRFTEAPEGKAFVLSDGRSLRNLKDLSDALEHMSDDVFYHHANQERNDFSNWARDVLQEQDLAEDLTGKANQLESQLTVLKHIAKKAF